MYEDDLNRRCRKCESKDQAPQAAEERTAERGRPVEPVEEETKVSAARELAERQMLGILLLEPGRWHQVKSTVHPEDFAGRRRRRLAEIYWQHQQDEGEPVFAEFLGLLEESALKELAVELVESAQQLTDDKVDETLSGVVSFLDEERRRLQEQKQLAELRRISQQSAGPEDDAAKWAAFVKNNQSLNLRRIGPVRRRTP